MVNIKRWLIHAFTPPWRWRLAFPTALLNDIERAIKQSESSHRGELRFAIENSLAPSLVWRGLTAKQRATEVFSNLKVWDTEDNSGVLIYILLADNEVHIIADRGINQQISQQQWQKVAEDMQLAFSAGDFRTGSMSGISHLSQFLQTYFPANTDNPNQLSDRPIIISR